VHGRAGGAYQLLSIHVLSGMAELSPRRQPATASSRATSRSMAGARVSASTWTAGRKGSVCQAHTGNKAFFWIGIARSLLQLCKSSFLQLAKQYYALRDTCHQHSPL